MFPGRRIGICVTLVISAACGERRPTPTELSAPVDVRRFVTPALTAALDQSGHFALAAPAPTTSVITAQEAKIQAQAAVATFAKFNLSYLERERGGPIDLAVIKADERVFYADSPYLQDWSPKVHPGVKKHTGPYYLVSFTSGGLQVLSVAVSALNTDVAVRNGKIAFSINHGNDFRIEAVPTTGVTSLPIAPEQAARLVSEKFGALVSSTPQLVLPSADHVPQYARWRVDLDRQVNVHSLDGKIRRLGTVYVGLGGKLSAAADEQPAGTSVALPNGAAGVAGRQTGIPLAFIAITN